MELISIIEDFEPKNDPALLKKAAALRPRLLHTRMEPVSGLPDAPLGRGDFVTLDFGRHVTGTLTISLAAAGSHQDAPAHIRIQLAERSEEFCEDPAAYIGWLSESWVQQELLHIDTLPAEVRLPRRYAFRYVRVTVIDTSRKYRLVLSGAHCDAVSCADPIAAPPLRCGDALLKRIDKTSLDTLRECMQEVFEDGPKRDRRLWIGDLRLQALTNYVSFRQNDLVKRCLYLFAGSRFPDGRVSACLFTEPDIAADDTYLFDYALMFPVALADYLRHTDDREALDDLYGTAMEQIDYGLSQCGGDGTVGVSAVKDCFIDWCEELDRTACAQGVLIYAIRRALTLAERKGDAARTRMLDKAVARLTRAARERFWDESGGVFLSNGQLSAASQTWMTLAGVPDEAQARRAMTAALSLTNGPGMTTPYSRHYFIMALLAAGMRQEAVEQLKSYWGGMLDAGADTFWECWNGSDPAYSPYGGSVVNSYCHAWSCTPAYIIRRFLSNDPAAEPNSPETE